MERPPRAVLAPPMPAAPRVQGHDFAVLAELGRETDARLGFQSLRRRLDVHQQSLARALRRLEREGLVARGAEGYRLTDRGLSALHGHQSHEPAREIRTVLCASLPPFRTAADVTRALGHRWFRGLRWDGLARGPGEATLAWRAERGETRVRLRVTEGSLCLQVEAPPRRAGEAFPLAHPVLAALSELYKWTGGPEGAASGAGEGLPWAM